MRLRVIAIMALLISALMVLSAAQSTDYSGKAKVVLQLTKMPVMPTVTPQSTSGGLVPETFGISAVALPDVPQGSTVQGNVLYSADPAVKTGQAYTLYVNYDPKNEPSGFQTGLVDKLKSGAIVGINDYKVDGDQLTVNVGTSGDWSKKIFVLDMQYTDPNEKKNPFMIDLNGFRPFEDINAFNTTSVSPLNTSWWGWGDSLFGGSSVTSGFSGIFDRIGHLFD
ncbi:MAG TPA: hypothetical protein VMC84_07000 [Methanocella sp.]|uniref:hypothetical protein n=1 Tax=Methanocella sp. TaxID=2052833 RepID=UPI002B97F8CA|nr:hypothetical protein [Methanocella sp.]HTY90910.1 hypothetical protein [Methanocella sp.]